MQLIPTQPFNLVCPFSLSWLPLHFFPLLQLLPLDFTGKLQGLALLELGDFSACRRSLRDAAALLSSGDDANQRAVRKALRRLQEAEAATREATQKQKTAFSKAMVRFELRHSCSCFKFLLCPLF